MAETLAPHDMSGGYPEQTLASRPVSVVDMKTKAGLGSATVGEMPASVAASSGLVRGAIEAAVESQLGPEGILGKQHRVYVDEALVAEINAAGRALEAEIAAQGEESTGLMTDLFVGDSEPLFGPTVEDSDGQSVTGAFAEEQVGDEDVNAREFAIGAVASSDEVVLEPVAVSATEMTANFTDDGEEIDEPEAELPGLRILAVGELSVLAAESASEDLVRIEAVGALALNETAEHAPVLDEDELVVLGSMALKENEPESVIKDDELPEPVPTRPEAVGDQIRYALAA